MFQMDYEPLDGSVISIYTTPSFDQYSKETYQNTTAT